MTELAKIKPAPTPTPAVQGDSGALLSMIERAARDPAVDIAKMERLFEMHERIESRRAEQAFNAAMAAAQAELAPVVRNKKNSETHSTYADLRAVSDAIKPIITKHGFAPSYGTDVSPRADHERIICDLAHKDGYSRRYMADVPFDNKGPKGTVNKSNTHAFGSTLSYGRRYLTLMMFDVATKDDDGNAAGSGLISEAQYKELADLIRATGTDLDAFLQLGGVESLADIPAAQFNGAKAKLLAKQAQMRKGAKP
jgi:hypothetical protein